MDALEWRRRTSTQHCVGSAGASLNVVGPDMCRNVVLVIEPINPTGAQAGVLFENVESDNEEKISLSKEHTTIQRERKA